MDLNINGKKYPWPENKEKNYSKKVNAAIRALVDSSLQKIGGEFRLKDQLNFGSTHGIAIKDILFNKNPDKLLGVDEKNNVTYGDKKLSYEADVNQSLTEINNKLSEMRANISQVNTDLSAVKKTADEALRTANDAKELAESYHVEKGDFNLDIINTNSDSAKCWGKYIKCKYTVELFGKAIIKKDGRSTGPSHTNFKWPDKLKPSNDLVFIRSLETTNYSTSGYRLNINPYLDHLTVKTDNFEHEYNFYLKYSI